MKTAAPPAGAAVPDGGSAARQTIAVIGDIWTLRILRSMFRGKRRHGEFVKEFGVSRAVLADRLDKLLGHGVLERHAEPGRHPEYRLSERGLDLWPLFLAMWQWEVDWGAARDPDTWAPDVPRAQVFHTVCNHAMHPQLRCSDCRQEVVPFETRPEEPLAAPARPALPAEEAGSSFRRARGGAQEDGAGATPKLTRVIGDRWNSAIVAAAFRGVRLFSRFEQELGIGPAQLSDRLAELQQLGILRPHAYAGARQEYRLTRAGIALFPMTLEMVRWGNRWLWPGGGSLQVRHLPCGQPLAARWHCSHCGEELLRETLRFS